VSNLISRLKGKLRLRVFQNRALRMTFRSKRKWRETEKVAQQERASYLYSAPSIIRVIKPRAMRYEEHVASM
jgi:predicted transcriptional regulator